MPSGTPPRIVLATRSVDFRKQINAADSPRAGEDGPMEALPRRVWGTWSSDDTEIVRTCVKKLRRKLGGDPRRPAYIVNERGVGYRMTRPEGA